MSPLFYLPTNNSCLAQCPSTYESDYQYYICVDCTAPCLICDNAGLCYQCASPYISY